MRTLLCCLLVTACSHTHGAKAPAAPRVQPIALPGAPPEGGVFMDYLAVDRAHHRVWVPAGNTGSVDVVDTATGKVTRIEGFATREVERRGQKRLVGPSSATVGEGVVYVGNRGDSSVCAIDAQSLARGACAQLSSMPDGLAWVAATREVWVTTPRDQSITILDAAQPQALTVKQQVPFEGDPEGFAVDDARGLFYTNLEDKDRTLIIDVKTRKIVETWQPGCGEDGPRGLALDHAGRFLFVACVDHVVALDPAGKAISRIDTGAGVDNLDYVESRHELYIAAGRAAKLTIAHVDPHGTLAPALVVPTAPGARNAVATEEGAVFVTNASQGQILVVSH